MDGLGSHPLCIGVLPSVRNRLAGEQPREHPQNGWAATASLLLSKDAGVDVVGGLRDLDPTRLRESRALHDGLVSMPETCEAKRAKAKRAKAKRVRARRAKAKDCEAKITLGDGSTGSEEVVARVEPMGWGAMKKLRLIKEDNSLIQRFHDVESSTEKNANE